MKKIGLLCLVLVFAVGMLGTGYAYWSETLNLGDNEVTTGNFMVSFDTGGGAQGLISNDDGVNDVNMWCNGPPGPPWINVNPDPDDNGGDPTAHQLMTNPVDRVENIASTTVVGNGTLTATVTIDTAYPSYWSTIFFSVRNWGTIPAKITSITVTEVSKNLDKTPVNIPLTICVPEPLDCDNDGIADLELHLSDDYPDRLMEVIMQGGGVFGEHGHYLSAVCGNLGIHVLCGAEEETIYDFTVEIDVEPFNVND